jgi:hypothetical protein
MARNRTRRRVLDRVPTGLRPIVGSVLLAGGVRLVDVLWTRLSGRRPPGASSASTSATTSLTGGDAGSSARAQASGSQAAPGGADDTGPGTLRDRLVYALLLGGVLRIAERAGLAAAGRRGRLGRDR